MVTSDLSADYVLEFCRTICKERPVYIPLETRYDLHRGECFNNVDAVIKVDGGKSIYGWSLAEWPNTFIEAEQHAVWQRPDGTMVDPTPPTQSFSRIAFLPDPFLGEWEFRDLISLPLKSDRTIADYIECARRVRVEMKRNGMVPSELARRARALDRRMKEKYGYASGK